MMMRKRITTFLLSAIFALSGSTAYASVELDIAPPENTSYEEQVVQLVNVEREKNGLSALYLDRTMSDIARTKSQDMSANKYFAHESPTYGNAGNMLRQFGINWSSWGENIAYGQDTPEEVVSAWMKSPGHRANILSNNFSFIGVGYTISNGTPYWTQLFVR
jgi:uncharacterized YkwD family protein